MIVFVIAGVVIFFIFLERTGPQSVPSAIYMAAFLIVMGVALLSRFFLAPGVPALRFLPLDEKAAAYLYRWFLAIAVVGSFGFLTCGVFRVAGVFFLIDDAFRVGDFVEAAGTKGMVEQISLRSLRLRHPRGMVNTIPFGDIGIVTNMSRDYIITKLDFRVRYDTNVEKVRKIIKKKVYKQILKNEDLTSKLLGKIKSQGVREMDDSAMIMRVKFKTIPGEQWVIRKEVYRLIQEAFREEGIEFAHRNVTVYIPPESAQSGPDETDEADAASAGTSGQKNDLLAKAGAAAALAVTQAEADKKT